MLKIQKTHDYSQFKFVGKYNREPAPKHIVESMQIKNIMEEVPAVCDLQMHVIDGQNRIKAAELLGLPVHYIVSPNVSIEDIGLFQNQKPWAMGDFLRFNKEHDKEDYRFVHELMALYNLPIHFVVYACNPSRTNMDDFRRGKFVVKRNRLQVQTALMQINQIAKKCSEIKKDAGHRNTSITSRAYRALWSMITKDDYDHALMMHKIEIYPSHVLAALRWNTEKDIGDGLEILYKCNSRKKTKK